MSPSIEKLREKVAKVPKYHSAKWVEKVNNMGPAQVIAIYKKFQKDGLFDKPKKLTLGKNKETYYQFTIFDYMNKGEQ